jgi:Uma2 family endonuclease
VAVDLLSTNVLTTDLHRYSIAEYHQLVASGGFSEDTHVELLEGWIVDMSPRSPAHENALGWLIDWLVANLHHVRYAFRVTGSVTIGASEPEPDISVFDRRPPTNEHPTHARLVIEVALTSADHDLRIKPRIYALAVDEYWVVDLERRVVVIHRDPAGGAYQTVFEVPAGQSPEPLAVAIAPLDTAALFSAAHPSS